MLGTSSRAGLGLNGLISIRIAFGNASAQPTARTKDPVAEAACSSL